MDCRQGIPKYVALALSGMLVYAYPPVRTLPDDPLPLDLGNVDKSWMANRGPDLSGRPSTVMTEVARDIRLTCRGSTPNIFWAYPRKDVLEAGFSSVGVVRSTLNGDWTSSLTIRNATYLDTGMYVCSCTDQSKEHSQSHARSKASIRQQLFIYVRDEGNLFQGKTTDGETKFIMGTAGQPVMFPCGVTVPEAQVYLIRLQSGGRQVLKVEQTEEDEHSEERMKIHYDSKLGFVLEDVAVRQNGAYICRAVFGNVVEERKVFLHVSSELNG